MAYTIREYGPCLVKNVQLFKKTKEKCYKSSIYFITLPVEV